MPPVGSKWLYLSYGVGTVVEADGGCVKLWFPLPKLHVTVYDEQKLVALPDQVKAEFVFSILQEDPGVQFQAAWVNRFRGYKTKLESGFVEEVAEVVRDLARKKKRSYGEQHMLNQSVVLLANAMQVSEKRIRDAACSTRG